MRARALPAPVFLGSLPRQTGRCAPSAHRSFAALYLLTKIYIFTIYTNKILQVRARAARVEYLSTGPPRLLNITFPAPRPSCRTLLSYAVPYWASLHSKELCCTLLSYAAPYWAMLHPLGLRCTLLSYTAPYWAMLGTNEVSCTLLSYAALYWATLHPIELRCPY